MNIFTRLELYLELRSSELAPMVLLTMNDMDMLNGFDAENNPDEYLECAVNFIRRFEQAEETYGKLTYGHLREILRQSFDPAAFGHDVICETQFEMLLERISAHLDIHEGAEV